MSEKKGDTKIYKQQRFHFGIIIICYFIVAGFWAATVFQGRFQNTIWDMKLDYNAIKYKDSNYVKYIVHECDLNESTNKQKIECMEYLTYNNFSYIYSGPKLKPADEIVVSGGDCKEWSVLYKTILNEMDIESEYRFIPEHVYITAFVDDMYVDIDQTSFVYHEFN